MSKLHIEGRNWVYFVLKVHRLEINSPMYVCHTWYTYCSTYGVLEHGSFEGTSRQIQNFHAVNLTWSSKDEGTLSISSEMKWKTKGNTELELSSCHKFFQWWNNTNLGTALPLFIRQRKPPGCKYEGIKFFWDMTPWQLENTNVSENITASIFIGFAVHTLKI